MSVPVLYSFRRCPYAMRARLAIVSSGCTVELREVLLRNKPDDMLLHSSKGEVPVLLTEVGVIEQSLEIMQWALAINDPRGWLSDAERNSQSLELIQINDDHFKQHLDHYKYADRFPEHSSAFYRQQGEQFLQQLDQRLQQHQYLCGEQESLADTAIFPFIRQFAFVDYDWFKESPYAALRTWLEAGLNSALFETAMVKHPPWAPGDTEVLFP